MRSHLEAYCPTQRQYIIDDTPSNRKYWATTETGPAVVACLWKIEHYFSVSVHDYTQHVQYYYNSTSILLVVNKGTMTDTKASFKELVHFLNDRNIQVNISIENYSNNIL
jgi:hypothetical protein